MTNNTLPLDLNLKPELLKNLDALRFHSLTDIQLRSLPPILAGKDVIAQAKTGSGKTAAFGLGILHRLTVERFRIQSLVLCPTRELADQVANEIRRLGRTIHNIKVLTLCGGAPMGPQIASLEHGAHIIVGTPGRVADHMRKGRLVLEHLTSLVLDEADRMLDMGFRETLDDIIRSTPNMRQTLLFSATYTDEIRKLSKQIMREAVEVSAVSTHTQETIEQHFFKLGRQDKRFEALNLVLHELLPSSCIIFCETKKETQDVADQLSGIGFAVLALHGDMDQREREKTLVRFANGSANLLVATDVAARGLDIPSVSVVINYNVARDAEVHTHRVGRTGRAEEKGTAYTLFSDRDVYKLVSLKSNVDPIADARRLPESTVLNKTITKPEMVTIEIDGGKKQKLRPGDILGALTAGDKISGSDVGKINMFPTRAYVAIKRRVSSRALSLLKDEKMKGRSYKARLVRR